MEEASSTLQALPDALDITHLKGTEDLARVELMTWLQQTPPSYNPLAVKWLQELETEHKSHEQPLWTIVLTNVTQHWNAPLPEGVSGIYQAGLTDWHRFVHCCSLTPSFEVWPLKLLYEGGIYEQKPREAFEELLATNGSDQVEYYDRSSFAPMKHRFSAVVLLNRLTVCPETPEKEFKSLDERYLWERETVEEVVMEGWDSYYEHVVLEALAARRQREKSATTVE